MIIRLLIIALLVWVFFLVLKQGKRRLRNRKTKHDSLNDPAAMVRCTRCGLHIPASEATYRNQQPYCSPEHSTANTD